MKQKIIIVSGYFNPIHKGHIDYMHKSKAFADKLFVIVNNDLQRELKGSKEFQNEQERILIIENLRVVDKCFLSIDTDRTVVETLKFINKNFSNQYDLAFANGGDQNNTSIPERAICELLNIELIDGVGDKIQSSSWLLKNK